MCIKIELHKPEHHAWGGIPLTLLQDLQEVYRNYSGRHFVHDIPVPDRKRIRCVQGQWDNLDHSKTYQLHASQHSRSKCKYHTERAEMSVKNLFHGFVLWGVHKTILEEPYGHYP